MPRLSLQTFKNIVIGQADARDQKVAQLNNLTFILGGFPGQDPMQQEILDNRQYKDAVRSVKLANKDLRESKKALLEAYPEAVLK